MFQFMLVVGLVLAYYGYAVTKNPRIWGDQGRDAIKEENWNRYVRYNGQFAMYAGFLMAALGALAYSPRSKSYTSMPARPVFLV